MRAALYRIEELPAEVVQRWDHLLKTASPVRTAFLSPAFSRAVNEVRGGVRVLMLEDEEGRSAFLPFQLRQGRALLGHAEKAGSSMSDFFGLVSDLPGRLDAETLLRDAKLSSLRVDHAIPGMCPFDVEDFESNGGIRVTIDDYAAFLANLKAADKKFVQNVFSRERSIVRDVGALQFEWHASNPQEALSQLIEAKRNQYRRTGVKDGLQAQWRRDLLNRLLTETGSTCRAVLSTLSANGEWIASKLSLSCEDVLHSWFSVYNPKYRRYGAGYLLFFRVFERGVAEGLRVFDFGEGEAIYKTKYQGGAYPLFKGAMHRRTLRGVSERALQSLSWRLEKAAAARRRKKLAGAPSETSDG
jgi:CelD/BcsL family acetyltransferase involved in cellulose biosynthesis